MSSLKKNKAPQNPNQPNNISYLNFYIISLYFSGIYYSGILVLFWYLNHHDDSSSIC